MAKGHFVDPDDGYITGLGEYSLGEAMDAATALLQLVAERKGADYAKRLDVEEHSGITETVIDMAREGSDGVLEEMFLALATGVDLVYTVISAVDKAAFMAEVENFGREE